MGKIKCIALEVLVAMIIFSSCSNNECPSILTGSFDITAKSFSKIPYASDGTLIFEDSEGDIEVGVVSKLEQSMSNSRGSKTCPYDSDFQMPTSFEITNYRSHIKFSRLNLEFHLTYSTNVGRIEENLDLLVYDDFSMSVTRDKADIAFRPAPRLQIVTDYRDFIDIKTFIDGTRITPKSIDINQINYDNVYCRDLGSDIIDFYFSFEAGLVGFHDKTTNKIFNLVNQ